MRHRRSPDPPRHRCRAHQSFWRNRPTASPQALAHDPENGARRDCGSCGRGRRTAAGQPQTRAHAWHRSCHAWAVRRGVDELRRPHHARRLAGCADPRPPCGDDRAADLHRKRPCVCGAGRTPLRDRAKCAGFLLYLFRRRARRLHGAGWRDFARRPRQCWRNRSPAACARRRAVPVRQCRLPRALSVVRSDGAPRA